MAKTILAVPKADLVYFHIGNGRGSNFSASSFVLFAMSIIGIITTHITGIIANGNKIGAIT